jgi:hypothetical protein
VNFPPALFTFRGCFIERLDLFLREPTHGPDPFPAPTPTLFSIGGQVLSL